MSQRESNLQWLKDILDQLHHAHQQLTWAEDDTTRELLTETMLRDLERCRRLCEELRRRTRARRAI